MLTYSVSYPLVAGFVMVSMAPLTRPPHQCSPPHAALLTHSRVLNVEPPPFSLKHGHVFMAENSASTLAPSSKSPFSCMWHECLHLVFEESASSATMYTMGHRVCVHLSPS